MGGVHDMSGPSTDAESDRVKRQTQLKRRWYIKDGAAPMLLRLISS